MDLEWRDLTCTTRNGTGPDKISKEPASCSLALRETGIDNDPNDKWRPAPGNNSETVNGTVRNYCNLLCPNADTVYLIKRIPQTHRSCFAFITYQHEKRSNDWYVWRNNAHLRTAIGLSNVELRLWMEPKLGVARRLSLYGLAVLPVFFPSPFVWATLLTSVCFQTYQPIFCGLHCHSFSRRDYYDTEQSAMSGSGTYASSCILL
ncbi:hypothetical protein DINM_021016 [Dirofilaria immitis]|nr:hypothetical protein [Dirofilaria immitis]